MTDEARASLERALPAYEIGDRLGEGAFGQVYAARHVQLGRDVAVKQLPRHFAEDEAVRERFVAEAQMVASLEHPHIVPVYDFVESDGSRYLIMERCDGSISDKFRSDGIVTDEACAAVLACLAGLDVAHAEGLLHRDVKPENLMYDRQGVVKLADFGIARDTGADTRRTATGMIIGTPAYMSPEQCRGDDLTPASDVYSVGMMAYELLTGGLPFPASDSVNGLLAHHLVTEPLPLLSARPELPGSIGEVIDRSLAKDLTVRHVSAEEMARDLARACVQAFGSGWLRRRRFVLHWPEIIAETERPADNSPRTGTIMVKAGDLTHDFESPAPPPQPAPRPVAAAPLPDDLAATSIEMPQPATVTDAAAVAAPAEPLADQRAPLVSTTGTGADAPAKPWALIGLVGVAIVALIAGIIVLTSGGGGGDVATTGTTPTSTANDTVVDDQAADDDAATGDTGDDAAPGDDTGAEQAEQDASPADDDPTEPTAAPEPTAAEPADEPAPEPTATPIPTVDPTTFNFVPDREPDGIDLTQLSYSGSPRPCPTGQERVACIYAASHDSDTDEFFIAYWAEGFVPELEPAGYHLHFYIDNVVGGDENKAGNATPGGSWRLWDAPFPAESFNGENGRTLFTGTEFLAVDGQNLCVLVATPDHQAIPNSGNCMTPFIADEQSHMDRLLARLQEGQYAGTCGLGVTAGLPSDWRWFDLTGDLAETARLIRPTGAAEAEQALRAAVDVGAVIYADGPAGVDGVSPQITFAIWPGEFTMNSDTLTVRTTLEQLGITVDNAQRHSIADREMVRGLVDNGDTLSATYVVPDFGYAIAMTFTAPADQQYNELADQIAATILGC